MLRNFPRFSVLGFVVLSNSLLGLYRSTLSLVFMVSTRQPEKIGLSVLYLFWNISEHDVGVEELGHLEMIGTIVYQLTKNLTESEIKEAGFDSYFVDHTAGIYPQAASGTPYSAASMQVKGDPIADLHEDLAAEQKARVTYDNILRFCDDPDVIDPIRFLREREVVHYQRFGENLRILTDKLDSKNFYAFNPAFDKKCFNKTK